MPELPLFSVIMPVYNGAPFLHRSIDSILGQSFHDFELIIVDDGSTDSSASICQEYSQKDSRIRLISQSNSGVSAARNTGIEHVSATWITFCDADDYVYPNWLQNFANCISDDYDLLIQGFETDRSFDGSQSGEKCFFDFDLDNTNALIQVCQDGILGYTFVKAFRSEIIEKYQIRFDTKLKFREDEVFVLDYIRYARRVKAIPNIGYFYFVPDFNKKYDMSVNSYNYVLESINDRHNYFDGIQEYSFYKRTLGDLSDGYILKMVKEGRRNLHSNLKCIKDFVHKNMSYHPMNPRLKQFLLNNRYDWVSYFILASYYYSRKMLQ
jgi:glycosyltransferase